MPKYRYQALNENGAPFSDVVDADSVEAANAIITSRGYIPVSVTVSGGGGRRPQLGNTQRAS